MQNGKMRSAHIMELTNFDLIVLESGDGDIDDGNSEKYIFESAEPCALCNFKTANATLHPCGCTIHTRCVFPWPISMCPVCDRDVFSVEPYAPREDYFIGHGFNRSGRWVQCEEAYCKMIKQAFNYGNCT
jgi:hypothetical protein